MGGIKRAAAALAVVLVSALVLVSSQSPASAAPNFQVPYACGLTVTAATYTGHSPLNAVDFQRSDIRGRPVLASASGTVSRVENEGNTSYGRWIEINHGDGWRTRYAHLDSQAVSVGQSVSVGQRIGITGNTGGSTGPHLHYEQRLNGSAVRATLHGVAVPYYGKTAFTSRNCGNGGNPYTPTEVCGSGYSVIDSQGLGSTGTVYLLYNSSNGNNCVTTIKSSSIGTPTATSAFLQVEGNSRDTDSGNFSYYAGPVRAAAPSTCVKWGGSAGSNSYESPYEHCA